MATFADIFSKLGTGINNFGTGLDTAMMDPKMQLGLQLLAAGGPQPNNVSTGQRLAQAGMGFMDMRAATAQQQQRQAEMQRQAAVRQRLQEMAAMEDGPFSGNPIARAILMSGGDPSTVKDMAGIMPQQPKAAAMPAERKVMMPDGRVQQEFLDPASMTYKPSNVYTPPELINAQTGQKNAATAEAGLDIKRQQATTAATQADTAQTRAQIADEQLKLAKDTAARSNANVLRDRKIADVQFRAAYKGTNARIDDSIKIIDRILDNKRLKYNFGTYGLVKNWPGSEASDALANIETLIQRTGFTEMQALASEGVKLYPTSNVDLASVQKSAGNLTQAQSYDNAVTILNDMKTRLQRAKEEGTEVFNATIGANQIPTSAQPTQSGPQPGTIEDGYQFMGGDPSNPQNWRKQ